MNLYLATLRRGTMRPKEEILALLIERHCVKYGHSIVPRSAILIGDDGSKSVYSVDDAADDYWVGISNYIDKLESRGDPVSHLNWRGHNAILDGQRRAFSQKLQFCCLSCGYIGPYSPRNNTCRRCKSTNFRLEPIETNMSAFIDDDMPEDRLSFMSSNILSPEERIDIRTIIDILEKDIRLDKHRLQIICDVLDGVSIEITDKEIIAAIIPLFPDVADGLADRLVFG